MVISQRIRLAFVCAISMAALWVAHPVYAQRTVDRQVARIRQQYEAIDSDAKHYTTRRYEKTEDTSNISFTGFYEKKSLRKIVIVSSGERDQITTKLYLADGKIFFVHRITAQFASIADNKGTKSEQRLYFATNKLIRWLGPGNIAKPVSNADAQQITDELLARNLTAKSVLETGKIKNADW